MSAIVSLLVAGTYALSTVVIGLALILYLYFGLPAEIDAYATFLGYQEMSRAGDIAVSNEPVASLIDPARDLRGDRASHPQIEQTAGVEELGPSATT